MSKPLLSPALVATLCGPALATPVAFNPVAGAGLPIIALGVDGLGISWLIGSRRRDLLKGPPSAVRSPASGAAP
jgi:hypothetical protein